METLGSAINSPGGKAALAGLANKSSGKSAGRGKKSSGKQK